MQTVRVFISVPRDILQWSMLAKVCEECAKRWQHSLDPNIDHSEWTTEDDERLMDTVGTYGRNWKMIGQKEFPCRSATDLKNRYVRMQRSPSSQATGTAETQDA